MAKAADEFARERLYDPELIRQRIRSEFERRGLEIKQLAALTGLRHWSLYKKNAGNVDYQTTDMIAIGKAFSAPTLWPLMDWDVAEAIDKKVFGKGGDKA